MEGPAGLAHSGHPLAVAYTWLIPHRRSHPVGSQRSGAPLWLRARQQRAPPHQQHAAAAGTGLMPLLRAEPCRAVPCRAAVPCIPVPRAPVPLRPSMASAWLGAVAVLLCTVLGVGWAEAQPFPFRDPTLPWHRRLEDLLGRLTPAEMVLQVRAR